MSNPSDNRYFFEDSKADTDPISGEKPIKLKFHANGQWIESKVDCSPHAAEPSTLVNPTSRG